MVLEIKTVVTFMGEEWGTERGHKGTSGLLLDLGVTIQVSGGAPGGSVG